MNDYEKPMCPICQIDDTVDFPWGTYHLNLLPPLKVSRCRQCGLLFLSPRPSKARRQSLLNGKVPEALNAYALATANYAGVTDRRSNIYKQRVEILRSLYSSRSKASTISILDLGASSGKFVQTANNQGILAYGIEPSYEGVQAAFHNNQLIIPQGMAEALPFVSYTFDIIHSNHVFEHLEDPILAAREVLRVLKPGGLMFIEVPNQFDNIMFQRDMLFRRVHERERKIQSIHHLWFFSKHTLGLLLREAGFRDVNVRDIFRGAWLPRQIPFTLLTRLAGKLFYGGEILQATGWK